MLKHNEVNPLTVFGLRRLEHCPPHFTKVTFDLRVSGKVISDWIWENLDGRFYLDQMYNEQHGGLSMETVAGFELAGEASYFSLVLDTINNYDRDLF